MAVSDLLANVRPQVLAASDLLTRQEAADYLRMRPQTLANWSTSGRYPLPFIKVGRAVRYRKADLDRFIESRAVGATAS